MCNVIGCPNFDKTLCADCTWNEQNLEKFEALIKRTVASLDNGKTLDPDSEAHRELAAAVY